MMEFIVPFIVGVVLIVLGISNMREIFHHYIHIIAIEFPKKIGFRLENKWD